MLCHYAMAKSCIFYPLKPFLNQPVVSAEGREQRDWVGLQLFKLRYVEVFMVVFQDSFITSSSVT